jgi:hypothetical protein
MNRWRVGEDRGSKEMNGCPLTAPGNKVWLDGSDIATNQPSSKLSHQQLGPCTVEACVRHGAYHLTLPPQLCYLHLVFPIVELSLALPNPIPSH